MKENTHIGYFKVENFKRFDSFEMDNIGQFNLIVGDNNVGKTTVLEALLFNEDRVKLLRNLFGALEWRKIKSIGLVNINYLSFFIKSKQTNKINYFFSSLLKEKKSNISLTVKEINQLTQEETSQIQAQLLVYTAAKYAAIFKNENNETQIHTLTAIVNAHTYIPFIPFHLGYERDLVGFYSDNIQNSKKTKDQFIENLRCFVEDIQDVEIATSIIPNEPFIAIRLKDRDEVFPVTMLGDGAVKLFRILAEISMCRGKRLMIDEVDTGVHYSRFKKYWKTILKAAEANDVQIFATTHSTDCLKYFNEALKEEDVKHLQSKARAYTLKELPDKSVKSYCYDYEKFSYAIEHEIEIRGEK